MKEETRGLFLAIILSTIAILLVNWIWPTSQTSEQNTPEVHSAINKQPIDDSEIYTSSDKQTKSTDEIIKNDARVDITNAKLVGSLRLKGARFDNILLSNYKQTLETDSADVELLMPSETSSPYYSEFGWLSNNQQLKLPNNSTLWKVIVKKEIL